ncbi:hypothetical protein Q8F55_003350 [Vanrija albida]|uniref:Enoyl reductase (ER) domain-containing protein n=1 Tax=Vanrija albida TaxID=181172 RepID=A0ABR3Q4S3_9TREE
MSDITFKGWAGHNVADPTTHLTLSEITPKSFDPTDVDVAVRYCGICYTDIGSYEGELGGIAEGRVCGHEIIGEVRRIGPEVTTLKVGDVVGIGAQTDSCGECEWCAAGEENLCATKALTFGGQYIKGPSKGQMVNGGFANYWRGPEKFAVRLPDALDPASSGPLLCGGVTVFAPLKKYGAGPGKRVGVIGLGGLGHMGVLIARAMGAEVTALSRGQAKKDDALKLGASSYVGTGSDLAADLKDHANTLDIIICTINPAALPIAEYLSLLRPRGTFVMVGVVPTPLQVPTFPLIFNSLAVAGSLIGSPSQIAELFELIAAHPEAAPWVNKYRFEDINTAMADFNAGKAKYRLVVVNEENGGKL